MGLDSIALKFLRQVTKNRGGVAVSLGYPDLIGTPSELSRQFGVKLLPVMETEYAKTSRRIHGHRYRGVDSEVFFDSIGFPVTSLDIRKWHGSEELFNLNRPRGEFAGMFDILLDVGTLEHVARPGVALEAARSMLKPGGHAIHVNPHTKDLHGWWSPHAKLYEAVYGLLVDRVVDDGLQYVLAKKTRVNYPQLEDLGMRGRLC